MRKKPWLRRLLIRRAVISLLLLAQVIFIINLLFGQALTNGWFSLAMQLVSLFLVLRIVNTREKPGYRVVWIVLLLAFPIIGIPLYFLFRVQSDTKKLDRRIRELEIKARPSLALNPPCSAEAKAACGEHSNTVGYLGDYAHFPVCRHTQTRFCPTGEEFYESMLRDLETAEHYIFLEYFIVNEGEMFSGIFDILRRKAAEGVDVRLLYDDMGCFLSLPADFDRMLEENGIKASVFNPFTPFLSAMQNNRDHRKICSVDGRIAYTGGVNLADEYINRKERFGHWKDSAIRLEGEAAWNMTVIFLEQWELTRHVKEDYLRFYPWHSEPCPNGDDGFVIPYADSPVDEDNVCEHVYMQMINSARRYLYICSPYLIVDDTLASAISLCAKSGVDVRIITPDKADKRFVHFTTQSYYRQFIRSGVRIYQYSGGFMHSKTFVSDDVVATVGTANLDYRSLYLHFEDCVWMYGSRAVAEVKDDFLKTLERCREMHEANCSCSGIKRLWQEILRLFGPLM